MSKELLGMFRTTTGLVFIQDDRFVRIPTGAVQPHVTVALRCLSRLVENPQGGLIRMEDFSIEQFLVQALIHGTR